MLDTNVILDVSLKREPFWQDSTAIFNTPDSEVQKYITSSICTDLYYVTKKGKGKEAAKVFIQRLLQIINVLSVEKEILLQAIESDFSDFEDAVQSFSAQEAQLDGIITRNQRDYSFSSLQIYSPTEFLSIIRS